MTQKSNPGPSWPSCFYKVSKGSVQNVTNILTLSKQALVFTCLQYKSFENTVERREIAHNEQFLLFPLFSTGFENFFIIFKIVVCKSLQFGRV